MEKKLRQIEAEFRRSTVF